MAEGRDVTVKQCLDILRQHEANDVTMRHLSEACQINASYSRDPTKQSQKNGSKISTKKRSTKLSVNGTPLGTAERRCQWCNREQHPRDCCPAKASVCNFCHKKGHFEKACRLKKKGTIKHNSQNVVHVSDNESSDERVIIHMIRVPSLLAALKKKLEKLLLILHFIPRDQW